MQGQRELSDVPCSAVSVCTDDVAGRVFNGEGQGAKLERTAALTVERGGIRRLDGPAAANWRTIALQYEAILCEELGQRGGIAGTPCTFVVT